MRIVTILVLLILLGILLLVSLGGGSVFALPAVLLGTILLTSRREMGRRTEILAVALMEIALALFFVPGFFFAARGPAAAGGSAGSAVSLQLAPYLDQNLALGAAMILVVLVAPVITLLLRRKRKDRVRLLALASLLLLFGMILVPVIPLGGATECHYQVCHSESTYGSISWMFACAGAEWTTPPGGVSTGLPGLPIGINTSLGDYFFAECLFF